MHRNGKTAFFLALPTLFLVACGPAQVIVTAELESGGIDNLEVRLLPYDRDQIFDSLANAFPTPEPEIPEELLEAQAEIAQAQQEWQEEEVRWNTLRDTLQVLNTQLEAMSRDDGRYRILFNDWNALDQEYARAERQVGSLFDRFQSLQAANIGQRDSVKIVRADWADQAFEDVDPVIEAKVEASGLEVLTDTTAAEGTAALDVPPGTYWVYARHERLYDELYWNVRVEVARGEPILVRLTEENAQVRPLL